ncbi:MAG: monofunctional biosynthetic peptidoglycan transglycosylase, partial [Hafniaceae bacterium]|nr:monofunctional biosynthetic peptidoglycan transglycosylase [Hafniaceae bacterium]
MKKRRGQGNSLLKRLRFWAVRAVLAVIGVWAAGIVIFAFLPVPFS